MFPWPGKRFPSAYALGYLLPRLPALDSRACQTVAARGCILERRTERISADLWVEAPAFTAGVSDSLIFGFRALALVIVDQDSGGA